MSHQPNGMTDVSELVQDYLKAFQARDLDRCLEFFNPDATLDWMMGTYKGTPSIVEWHNDRFAADLKILKIEDIAVNEEKVTVDVVVHSKRLAAWRLPSLGGRVTVQFREGKIQHSKFAAKSINPQQNWA